jgi:hypothetical protein
MTTRNVFFSIALICLGLSQSVYAQSDSEPGKQACSTDLINVVGRHIQLEDFSYGNAGVLVADACKVWPKDNTITLLAIAYLAKPDDVLNLAVAMIDNSNSKVIASYKDVLGKQAAMHLGRNSLNIDTARYDVTRGIRAFGVDITRGNIADCGASGQGRVRNLYVLEGNEIRPILEDFYLSSWRFVSGGDPGCISRENVLKASEPVIETIVLKIAIDKSVTNDYFDLSIFSMSSINNGSQSNREPFQYELKYDGKKYPVNEMNKAFLKWLR